MEKEAGKATDYGFCVIFQISMTTITLDTLKTVQKLQTKGFTAEQAEGIVETLTESELVTKSDLNAAISGLEGRLYRAMLIQTGAITAIVLGIIQLVF